MSSSFTVSGTYYGIKKLNGKRKEHSLGVEDKDLARRKLKDWLRDLENVDSMQAKDDDCSVDREIREEHGRQSP